MEDLLREAKSEKRRRRPPLACVACRRRKVRCDRKLPCQNCVKAHRASNCAYVPDERLEPRETTQKLTDGAHRRDSATDDDMSAPVGGGSFSRLVTTTASRYPRSNSNSNGEGEFLHHRVRQLEKQLEQVLASKRASPDAAPGTTSAPLLRKHSGPSAARVIGEEWERNVGRRPECLNTESADRSGTRPMLVKSRYLGGSHWMRGMSLVSPVPFLFSLLHSSDSRDILNRRYWLLHICS